MFSRIATYIIVIFSYVGYYSQSPHAHDHENQSSGNTIKFIENKGQWKDQVLYKADVPGGKIYLEDNGVLFHFIDFSAIPHGPTSSKYEEAVVTSNNKGVNKGLVKQHAVRSTFVGGKKVQSSKHKEKSTEYYNYFKGSDPSKWASKVYGYSNITLHEIYDAIDVNYYIKNQDLKYDIIVHPGGNPDDINIKYEGQKRIVERKNYVQIETSLGEIQENYPYAYQNIEGEHVQVPCVLKIKDGTLSYKFPNGYNEKKELIIDPTLVFATYSGSYADNFGMTATPGVNGELFSGGTVFETGYPVTLGAFDETFNNAVAEGLVDVVITKYSNDGTTIEYATLLGGTEGETVHSIIANDNNELYLFGATASRDFPISGSAYQQTHGGGNTFGFDVNGNGIIYYGGSDIFVSKFSADGTSLLASTFMGGSDNDGVNYTTNNFIVNDGYFGPYGGLLHNYGDQFRGEILLDDNENVYIGSCTRSNDFPVINGFNSTYGGLQDGVVFKLDNNLSNLIWSSYIGGSNYDACYGIRIASDGSCYFTGGSLSNNIPTTPGAYQTNLSGDVDGIIGHINTAGTTLLELSYLGSTQYDQLYFVELDHNDDVYLYGQTLGSYVTSPGVYSNPNSSTLLLKLSSDLSSLGFLTTLGNGTTTSELSPSAFLVDNCGNIYLSGWGNSRGGGITNITNMPLTPDALDNVPQGSEFYLMVLEGDAVSLLYGSYFGGTQSADHVDGGTSRFDKSGVVYQSMCGSCGFSNDIPTTPGAWSSTNNSSRPGNPAQIGCNNAVFKFDMEFIPVSQFVSDSYEGCVPMDVQLTNLSTPGDKFLWEFENGDLDSINFTPLPRTFADTGLFSIYLYVTDTICGITDTSLIQVRVTDTFDLQILTPPFFACSNQDYEIIATTYGDQATYNWYTVNQQNGDTTYFTDTDSVITVNSGENALEMFTSVVNGNCSYIDSTWMNVTVYDFALSNANILCVEEDTVNVIADVTIEPFDTIVWSPSSSIVSGQGGDSVMAIANPPKWVYATATDSNTTTGLKCVYTDSIFIQPLSADSLGFDAIADPAWVFKGQESQLIASPDITSYSYEWTPNTYLDDPLSATPVATIDQDSVEYTVGISYTQGCDPVFRSVTVRASEYICGPPYIFVPNAFTPNGDGENDVLYVRGSFIEELDFKVYNRWGELVFETQDLEVGWDGIYKEMQADPAVFVYYLKATCPGGEEYFEKGNVTIIK